MGNEASKGERAIENKASSSSNEEATTKKETSTAPDLSWRTTQPPPPLSAEAEHYIDALLKNNEFVRLGNFRLDKNKINFALA